MKCTAILFCVIVISASALSGQQSAMSAPSVKGHRIGESFNDYLIVENGSREKAAKVLTDCSTLLNDAKARRADPIDFELKSDPCLQMAKLVNGEAGSMLKSVSSATTPLQTDYHEFFFEASRLVKISLYIHEDYGKVKSDLIEKYGQPDSEEQVRYQNGFGAVFVHPRAAWVDHSGAVVLAMEDTEASGGSYPVSVTVADSLWTKSQVDKKKNRPNSLD